MHAGAGHGYGVDAPPLEAHGLNSKNSTERVTTGAGATVAASDDDDETCLP